MTKLQCHHIAFNIVKNGKFGPSKIRSRKKYNCTYRKVTGNCMRFVQRKIAQLNTGIAPLQRKKYKCIDTRIQVLLANYEIDERDAFLDNVAKLLKY